MIGNYVADQTEVIIDRLRPHIEHQLKELIKNLKPHIEDQATYGIRSKAYYRGSSTIY